MLAEDILQRYRAIRELVIEVQQAAAQCASTTTILRNAARLGLAQGAQLVGTDDELNLALDLAVHTARRGRARPIDRCTPPKDDDATRNILAALRKARFSIFAVTSRHPVVGLMLRDTIADEDIWLVDVNAAASFPLQTTFAARLCQPDAFWVGCGGMIPIYPEWVEAALFECLPWITELDSNYANDRRFAAAIYRHAIEMGHAERVRHLSMPSAA